MPRKYRHIEEYEKEIIKMYEEGKCLREIGETLGFTYKEITFINDSIFRSSEKYHNKSFSKFMQFTFCCILALP